MRFVLIFAAAMSLATGADLPPVHIRNFSEVNQHLYRGGEPTVEEVGALNALGIKLIIDLREPGNQPDREKERAASLGIKYVNVPLPRLAAPPEAEVERVLSLLSQNESVPVFVHCWRGKDRTGTIIACYRIQHDGWNSGQAQEEANRFGMSRLQHAMRAYITRFQALPLPPAAKLRN
jgi:tyrosine-protein phosphatase SIW14